jgi:hypothetical protein
MKTRILQTFENIDKNDISLLHEYKISATSLNTFMRIHKFSSEYLIPADDDIYKIDYMDVIELLPVIPTIASSTRREKKYILHLENSDIIQPIRQMVAPVKKI